MPLSFDELSATTFKNYRKTFSDNIMKKIALYSFMKKNGNIERKRGGLKLVEPLMYGLNTTFKSYSGYDTLDTTPQSGITAAEYDWKNVAVSVTISKEEEDQNSGESRILNLLKGKIQQAEKTYTLRFDQMLFGDGSGNGGKDFQGLDYFLRTDPTASVSIGGIDQNTYSWWRNQYATPATFVTNGLGLINMRQMYNKCCREGDAPKVIVTHREVFETYESLMTSLERFTFDPKKNLHGDLGFETLTFKGLPMFWDYYCAEKTMYFLNTDYLKLVMDSNSDFEMTEWRVPFNQMAKTAFIIARGQLVCNNRELQGKIVFTALS